jgi:hypothetical protein
LNLSLKSAALFLTLTLAAYASAETLTGTVNNGTTGKAAAGDDVVLIKLANGMEEAARRRLTPMAILSSLSMMWVRTSFARFTRALPITGWPLRERLQCNSMFST